MNTRKVLISYVLLLLLFILLLGIAPISRRYWLFESALVLGVAAIILYTSKKLPLSKTSYTLIFIYFGLVSIAAHYTYIEVPMEVVKQIFETQRNPYDRIVHFAFGLLFYYPLLEITIKKFNIKSNPEKYLIPLVAIAMFAGIYEIIEFGTEIILSPENPTWYFRGDTLDTQKDIILAVLGSFITMGGIAISQRNKSKKILRTT